MTLDSRSRGKKGGLSFNQFMTDCRRFEYVGPCEFHAVLRSRRMWKNIVPKHTEHRPSLNKHRVEEFAQYARLFRGDWGGYRYKYLLLRPTNSGFVSFYRVPNSQKGFLLSPALPQAPRGYIPIISYRHHPPLDQTTLKKNFPSRH